MFSLFFIKKIKLTTKKDQFLNIYQIKTSNNKIDEISVVTES